MHGIVPTADRIGKRRQDRLSLYIRLLLSARAQIAAMEVTAHETLYGVNKSAMHHSDQPTKTAPTELPQVAPHVHLGA